MIQFNDLNPNHLALRHALFVDPLRPPRKSQLIC